MAIESADRLLQTAHTFGSELQFQLTNERSIATSGVCRQDYETNYEAKQEFLTLPRIAAKGKYAVNPKAEGLVYNMFHVL